MWDGPIRMLKLFPGFILGGLFIMLELCGIATFSPAVVWTSFTIQMICYAAWIVYFIVHWSRTWHGRSP